MCKVKVKEPGKKERIIEYTQGKKKPLMDLIDWIYTHRVQILKDSGCTLDDVEIKRGLANGTITVQLINKK